MESSKHSAETCLTLYLDIGSTMAPLKGLKV
jgi:hypothetical protein